MLACFVDFILLPCFWTWRSSLSPNGFCAASWNSLCGPTFWTFGLKARGFLLRMFFLESLILFSFCSVLWQLTQQQLSSQNLPSVKHSQYIFKHLDLLHLQLRFYTVVDFFLITVSYLSSAFDVLLSIVFFPSPRVALLVSVSGDSPWSDCFKMESFECCFPNNFWSLLRLKAESRLLGEMLESNLPVFSFLLS